MKFGRKKSIDESTAPTGGSADDGFPDAEVDQSPAAPQGPFDAEKVQIDPERYIDLGSVLIPPIDGAEVRMHVDEESGEVMAVLVMNEQGAVEVRAFAASRNVDQTMWDDVRRELGAETTRRGGTATEIEGPFGPELHTQVPVTADDGEQLVQPSRVIGVTGERWFLRATLLGAPAIDEEAAGPWEELIRGIGIRRGADPMAPGSALPLVLPPQATRADLADDQDA